MNIYIHAYMHTCIHAYMHTCIHAYTYICIYHRIEAKADNTTKGLLWMPSCLFLFFMM